MNKKTVITRVNKGVVYCLFSNDTAVKCDIFYDDERSVLGNIYVGYVCDIVKNINCAFVEYEQGKKAYLQLSQNVKPVFLNKKNTDKICCGDRIIIQISKEAVKTKNPVCTTGFELSGRYVVLSHGSSDICFSKKIKDNDYKKNLTNLLMGYMTDNSYTYEIGITIRTNAYTVPVEEIFSELNYLIDKYKTLIKNAYTRTKNFLLYEADTGFMSLVRDMDYDSEDIIVTDDKAIYNMLYETGLFRDKKTDSVNDKPYLKLYDDELLPLYKLNSLEKVFDDITSRKIWLKSGGYLIIDYTEAMTVIDVNSGKCDKGRDKEKTFLSINLEAAKEIARLLSLRNISGIIIIDFIDMESDESCERLKTAMIEYTGMDKIHTNVVDFTKLRLMEITRKKTRDRVKVHDNIF